MRKSLAFILVGFLSICASAQLTSGSQKPTDPTAPVDKAEPRAIVSGKVISAATGEPLKKAYITISKADMGRRAQPYTAMTKEDGIFEVADIPAGQYRMTVNRNGYVRHVYGARNARQQQGGTLTLAAGQRLRDLTVKLTPGAVIAGRIVDPDGETMSSVMVAVLRYSFMDNERRLVPAESAMTNDLGEFRIFGLQPRSYYLSAQMRSSGSSGFGRMVGMGVMVDDGGDESYGSVYYPGVSEVANANAIDVHAGEEFRADMTIMPLRTYRVSGRVLDVNGEPAKEGMAMLMSRGKEATFMPAGMGQIGGGPGARDGKFEIRGVAPGSYTLTAFIRGDEMSSAQVDVDVTESNVENVNVALTSAREIPGTVRIEGDNSKLKTSDLSLFFMPARGGMFGGFGNAQVKEDGTFVAKNLMLDDYIVSVNLTNQDAYVKSIRAGGEETLYSGLNVARVRPPLEIVISTRPGSIEGTVKDGDSKATQGALVVLIPEKPARSRQGAARTATTDQNGYYKFRALRPGKYQLYALDDADDDEYQDPAFAKRHADQATSIEVKESTVSTAELKLVPGQSPGADSGN
jgi:protocatechuate 3,4-dioxygenase beta subunit